MESWKHEIVFSEQNVTEMAPFFVLQLFVGASSSRECSSLLDSYHNINLKIVVVGSIFEMLFHSSYSMQKHLTGSCLNCYWKS